MSGPRFALLAALLLAAAPVYASENEHRHSHAGPGAAAPMRGMLGAYGMTREASGTSWQPEAAPMEGVHLTRGDWMLMAHGTANLIYNDQGGARGDEEVFSSNMLMLMAQRPLGPGTFGARSMLSLEPWTMDDEGYALLLQTGETADGREHLVDRQHPHDLFMELALTYSVPVGTDSSLFVYAGLPGEPALGPPAFMHRFSGMDNPEAPLTHHWLDSTHITFGVATLGYIWNDLKLEASAFNGREPDEDRWDIEGPNLNSYAARLSYNPTGRWAFQISGGHLNSPEQLHPEVDTNRVTASASYHRAWGERHWQSTLAWGRNRNRPGRILDAFLLESALRIRTTHTVFARAETVEKDELFHDDDPLAGKSFSVNKLSLGYIYDFPEWHGLQWGLGAVGSVHVLPGRLREAYDDTPVSMMLFARVKL